MTIRGLPPWTDLPHLSAHSNDLMRRGWELINLSETLHDDPDALAECWAEAARVEAAFQEQRAVSNITERGE